MRLIIKTFEDLALSGAVNELNRLGLARSLFSLHDNDDGVIAILRAEDYSNYCWICEKLDVVPVNSAVYFGTK